jgi:hypothetical protein
MSKKSAVELGWFLRNANLFLQDMDIRPQPSEHMLFWDTADVKGALLGMADFYDRKTGEFQDQRFTSKTTLVRSLMSAKWFGQIWMLKPHQAEFINGLNQLFGNEQRETPPGGPKRFYRDALSKTLSVEGEEKDRYWETFEELLQSQIASAERLFSACQSVDTWAARLDSWKTDRLLSIGEEGLFDFSKALVSDEFLKLRRYLNAHRGEFSINNFTDAMALCQLDYILRDALKKGKPLPLFFASDAHLRDAIFSMSKPEFLAYRGSNGRYVSIIRDADYYLMRASLWPLRDSSTDSYQPVADPLDGLKEMRDEVQNSVGDASHEDLEKSAQLHDIRDTLARKIDDLKRLWFLDSVWLPSAAKHMAAATERYMKGTQKLLEDDARAQMRQYINELMEGVDKSARELFVLQRAWTSIEMAAVDLRKRWGGVKERSLQAGKLAGLVRFGIPKAFEARMDSMLTLLIEEETSEQKRVIGELVATLGTQSPNAEIDQRELGASLGVLWILNLPELVQRIARSVARRWKGDSVPVWLLMIHGASLLSQESTNRSALESLLADLKRRAMSKSSQDDQIQAMIAIGYLNFHLWLSDGGVPFWQTRPSASDHRVVGKLGTVAEAINWASRALESSTPGSVPNVYALNQYIFYVTEGGDERTFASIKHRAHELLSYRWDKRGLWQYNFTDTLAHYFYRLTLDAGPGEADRFRQLATKYADEAARDGAGESDIETFRGVLANQPIADNT